MNVIFHLKEWGIEMKTQEQKIKKYIETRKRLHKEIMDQREAEEQKEK